MKLSLKQRIIANRMRKEKEVEKEIEKKITLPSSQKDKDVVKTGRWCNGSTPDF